MPGPGIAFTSHADELRQIVRSAQVKFMRLLGHVYAPFTPLTPQYAVDRGNEKSIQHSNRKASAATD